MRFGSKFFKNRFAGAPTRYLRQICNRLLVEYNDGNCVHLTEGHMLYVCLVDPNRTTKLVRLANNPAQDSR